MFRPCLLHEDRVFLWKKVRPDRKEKDNENVGRICRSGYPAGCPRTGRTGQTAFFMEDFMAAEKLATGKTSDSDEVASLIEKADPAGAEKVFRMLNDRAIEACLPAYRKHYEGLKPEVNSQSDLEKLAAGARPATADCRLNYYVKHWKNVNRGVRVALRDVEKK